MHTEYSYIDATCKRLYSVHIELLERQLRTMGRILLTSAVRLPASSTKSQRSFPMTVFLLIPAGTGFRTLSKINVTQSYLSASLYLWVHMDAKKFWVLDDVLLVIVPQPAAREKAPRCVLRGFQRFPDLPTCHIGEGLIGILNFPVTNICVHQDRAIPVGIHGPVQKVLHTVGLGFGLDLASYHFAEVG